MTLKEFNNKYEYVSDKAQYGVSDVWEVMVPGEGGKYSGDCESYCLTIRKVVDGFRKLELWYCRINGEGHCVGKLGELWVDCNFQELRARLPVYYTDIRKYAWWEVIGKRIIGTVVHMWHKLRKT